MPHEMSDEERRAFLLAPGRTGHLATVRPDGRPHDAPIRFTLDDDHQAFRPWSRRIAARYVPVDEVDAYADRNAVAGELLVRLHPGTTVAVADLAGWD